MTSESNFDNLDKFAQNTAARPLSSSIADSSPVQHSAIKFEDTNLRLCPELVLDPKLSA